MAQLTQEQLAKLRSLTQQVGESPWVPFDVDIAWQLAQLSVASGYTVSDGAFMEKILLNPLKALMLWVRHISSLNEAGPVVPPEPTPEEVYIDELTPGTYDMCEGLPLAEAQADEVFYGTDGRGFNITEDATDYNIIFNADFAATWVQKAAIVLTQEAPVTIYQQDAGSTVASTTTTPSENPPGEFFASDEVTIPGRYISRIKIPIAHKTHIKKIYIGPSVEAPVIDSTTPSLQVAQLVNHGGGVGMYTGASTTYPACTFTTIGSFVLTSMDMRMGRFNAGSTGHVYARILATSAGAPIGTILAESTNSVDVSTLETNYPDGNTPVTFNFTPVQLQAGTTYAIELHTTDLSGFFTARMINDAAGPAIGLWASTNFVTWTVAYSQFLYYFKMFGYGVGSGEKSGDCAVSITNGGGDSFECAVIGTDLVSNTGGNAGFTGNWIRS